MTYLLPIRYYVYALFWIGLGCQTAHLIYRPMKVGRQFQPHSGSSHAKRLNELDFKSASLFYRPPGSGETVCIEIGAFPKEFREDAGTSETGLERGERRCEQR